MPQVVELIAIANDVAIIVRSTTTSRFGELLEETAENILKWLENAGMEIAVEKTKVLIITNKMTNNTVNV